MVHGYDQYVSYGYPGGLDLKDIVGSAQPSKGRPKRPILVGIPPPWYQGSLDGGEGSRIGR